MALVCLEVEFAVGDGYELSSGRVKAALGLRETFKNFIDKRLKATPRQVAESDNRAGSTNRSDDWKTSAAYFFSGNSFTSTKEFVCR